MEKRFSSLSILGVRVDNVTMNDAVHTATSMLHEKRNHMIVTVNPEFIMHAQRDREYLAALNGSDLAIPDGIGIIYCARLKRYSLHERVSGSDFFFSMVAVAAEQQLPIYLLGGYGNSAKRAASILTSQYRSLTIAGAENEYDEQGKERTDREICERIERTHPAMLFVAFGGSTKQEKWIARNLHHLPSVKFTVGVGGTFDYICGSPSRAPAVIRRLSLEWLWRLLQQPRYRIRRVWRAVIQFPFRVLTTPNAIHPLNHERTSLDS
jgi:N-acetylglucosaminyldiphosphoundecaprenol N-acetyl-beta-D-mannosaminyltransferase